MVYSVVEASSTDGAAVERRRAGRDKPLEVVVVDDHPVFAQALALAIDSSSELRCAGVASTAQGALSLVEQVQPDAIVMDVVLGDDDGTAAREAFQAGVPLGRYSMPEEQASLATWLLSDESGYATGGGFPLDGGIGAGPYSR